MDSIIHRHASVSLMHFTRKSYQTSPGITPFLLSSHSNVGFIQFLYYNHIVVKHFSIRSVRRGLQCEESYIFGIATHR